MAVDETLGMRLRSLGERSDLKGDSLARRLGYEGRSSIQRFIADDYDPEFPTPGLRKRFDQLVGLGTPPLTLADIAAAFGEPEAQALVTFDPKRSMARAGHLARDVPVYGTGLGATLKVEVAGNAASIEVEQQELDHSLEIGWMRRPENLEANKDLYGIYVLGSSMYPRFDDGQAVLVDPMRPPLIGDDVIVHMTLPDEHDGDRVAAVLVKRLRKRTHECYELEQFNPPLTFRVARDQVRSVHRIVTYGELLT